MNDLDKRLKIMSRTSNFQPSKQQFFHGGIDQQVESWKGVSWGAKEIRKAETITMTNEQ